MHSFNTQKGIGHIQYLMTFYLVSDEDTQHSSKDYFNKKKLYATEIKIT
jgi:hypothetical protein